MIYYYKHGNKINMLNDIILGKVIIKKYYMSRKFIKKRYKN